jgi:hypothetical protein
VKGGHRPIEAIEVLGAVVILVVVALLVGAVAGVRSLLADPPEAASPFGAPEDGDPVGPIEPDVWVVFEGTPISRHNFPGEPWAADLLTAQQQANKARSDDEVGWVNLDLRTTGTTVQDGRRVTVATPDPDVTIWLFGGSTVYGFGQRDEHTIASELVREAAADGRRARVVNYGVSAYVLAQEATVFESELAAGRRPDVAVFFDGVNDIGVAWEREVYDLLEPEDDVHLAADELLVAQRLEDRDPDYRESHDADRRVELVAAQYGRSVRRVQQLGERYDVPVVNIWQPMLMTTTADRPMLPTVLHNLDLDAEQQPSQERIIERMLADAAVDDVVDLSDLFDDVDIPTFFDWAHVNEAAARLQAAAVYDALLPTLDELSG